MNRLNRKKQRLRLALCAAGALGCSSATVSGTLAAFGMNVPPPHALTPADVA